MCNKNPFDIALYSRLLWELKPATIIEIGYKFGGSALWFADQASAMGLDTRLYCIDIEQREEFSDPRITFVHGNGRDLSSCLTPEVLAGLKHPWLIVEDADHHYLTTHAVMKFMAPHMCEGDYLSIEDGICDTFGNEEKYAGGPNKAVEDIAAAFPGTFEVDLDYCDFFGNNVTWCTNGWLRRTAVDWEAAAQSQSAPEGRPAVLEAAKAALEQKDYGQVRRLLVPLVEKDATGLALFFLARAEWECGNGESAGSLLEKFLAQQPQHPGARTLNARRQMAQGNWGAARTELNQALTKNPGLKAARLLLAELDAEEAAGRAAELIKVVDDGHLAARDNGPGETLANAARALGELPVGPQWATETLRAKVAFFRHSNDPVAALRSYDPDLIKTAVDFDFVTWPKRIQKHVQGKSILDVGCGSGGHGMAFLIAGARSYLGVDPEMDLDNARARNKRAREWADMGVTPRVIAERLPAIGFRRGRLEDLSFDEKFDTISLHNVTEHLMDLDLAFKQVLACCQEESTVVFAHHNFYCWNGFRYVRHGRERLDDPNSLQVNFSDWHHIDGMADLPETHVLKTELNRVRLDELREVTERYFEIVSWKEKLSSQGTLDRLTPPIIARVKAAVPDLTERDLATQMVYCTARPKK